MLQNMYATAILRPTIRMVNDSIVPIVTQYVVGKQDRAINKENGMYVVSADVDIIPLFNHPLTITAQSKTFTVIDPRPFVGIRGDVKKPLEMNQLKERGLMSQLWATDRASFEPFASSIPQVFASWVASAVGSRYSPNEFDLGVIRLGLASYYHLMLLNQDTNSTVDNDYLYTILNRFLVQKMRLPSSFVEQIISDSSAIDAFRTLSGTLSLINRSITSPIIKLDEGQLLVLIIDGSWFGHAAKEICGSALTYPPSMIYMTNLAVNNSLYRKTKVGAAVEFLKRSTPGLSQVEKLIFEVKLDFSNFVSSDSYVAY